METVAISRVTKSFGANRAVDEVSFDVRPGEILGLLGPNGAGKTTTIRLILDILKPDRGEVSVFGGPMTEAKKDRIGYMPEDRGLYKDVKLERCLVYLGTLKGLTSDEARQRAHVYLKRFDLLDHRHKKISELSKGMQQKAQIIVTLLHHPELVMIDEPFSGLDPVNTELVTALLQEQRQRGVAIIMSTHQMHQVEELCDRIVLINRGRVVLHGELSEVRRRFSGRAVLVGVAGAIPEIPGVEQVEARNHLLKITLRPGISPHEVLRQLVEHGVALDHFEVATPTLNEIFVRVVSQTDEAA